jgi:hypothetical protein
VIGCRLKLSDCQLNIVCVGVFYLIKVFHLGDLLPLT